MNVTNSCLCSFLSSRWFFFFCYCCFLFCGKGKKPMKKHFALKMPQKKNWTSFLKESRRAFRKIRKEREHGRLICAKARKTKKKNVCVKTQIWARCPNKKNTSFVPLLFSYIIPSFLYSLCVCFLFFFLLFEWKKEK